MALTGESMRFAACSVTMRLIIQAEELPVGRRGDTERGWGEGCLSTHRLGEGATDRCRHTLPLSCCLSFSLPHSFCLSCIIPNEPAVSEPMCSHARHVSFMYLDNDRRQLWGWLASINQSRDDLFFCFRETFICHRDVSIAGEGLQMCMRRIQAE